MHEVLCLGVVVRMLLLGDNAADLDHQRHSTSPIDLPLTPLYGLYNSPVSLSWSTLKDEGKESWKGEKGEKRAKPWEGILRAIK